VELRLFADEPPSTEADLGRWPQAFNDRRRPLKVGIDKDMGVANDCPAIRAWVTHPQYLRNMVAGGPGGPRFDLDGAVSGSVSRDERLYAWKQLQFVRDLMIDKRVRGRPLTKDEKAELKLRLPRKPTNKETGR
jgi:sRNA-binding protein